MKRQIDKHLALFELAVNFLKHSNLESATKCFLKIIAENPLHFESLYFLGHIELSQNKISDALEYYTKAHTVDPEQAEVIYHLAITNQKMKNWKSALDYYDLLIFKEPKNAIAYNNRGNVLREMHQLDSALTSYEMAVFINQDYFEAHNNLALLLQSVGRKDQALSHFEKASSISPHTVEIIANQGLLLLEMSRYAESLECFDRALLISQDNPVLYCQRGKVLRELNCNQEAIKSFEAAIKIDPMNCHICNDMGLALRAVGRLVEALKYFEKSIEINENYSDAHINKGLCLTDLERFDESIVSLRRAVELGDVQAYWNMALCYLSAGDFQQGWFYYNHFLEKSQKNKINLDPRGVILKSFDSPFEQWDGKTKSKTLLIWGEQGIGDQLLFGTILHELTGMADQIIVAIDKRLLPLFGRALPNFQFIDIDNIMKISTADYQLPIGSLPKFFRHDRDYFPTSSPPSISADCARVSTMRTRLKEPGKLLCGISWLSKAKNTGNFKSLSLRELLLPLSVLPITFVDLQYGDTSIERERLKCDDGIEVLHIDEIDNHADLDGLSVIIQSCDIVLSVSNSTAHLAGSLHKQTLLLCSSGPGKIWYWNMHEGRNLWYPSVETFVQEQVGDWGGVLGAVSRKLKFLCAHE